MTGPQSPIRNPNPQSSIPNPNPQSQSPIPNSLNNRQSALGSCNPHATIDNPHCFAS
jgi:hypothetical protein